MVIPDLWRSDATGETLEARTLTPEQWERLAAGHDRLGKALLDEYGVHQQFHSHADSHVGTTARGRRGSSSSPTPPTPTCAWTPATSPTTAATTSG